MYVKNNIFTIIYILFFANHERKKVFSLSIFLSFSQDSYPVNFLTLGI